MTCLGKLAYPLDEGKAWTSWDMHMPGGRGCSLVCPLAAVGLACWPLGLGHPWAKRKMVPMGLAVS